MKEVFIFSKVLSIEPKFTSIGSSMDCQVKKKENKKRKLHASLGLDA